MTFYILRDLEKYLGWLATVILFLGTGIGGNIASVLFVPYNPQVQYTVLEIKFSKKFEKNYTV